MTQGLFTREHGVKTARLRIPAAPRVHIGKTMFENVTCPKDYVLAGPGVGYKRLFEGLVPERLTIIGSSIGGAWAALAHAVNFAQLRIQFGKPLFSYQGISHIIADLFSKTSAYTSFAFQTAEFYEKKIGEVKRRGETPNKMDEMYCAVLASQGKYLTALGAHYGAYEIVQTMGGRGALDEPGTNLIINQLENLSRISEVVGGHRNVQLMIVEGALRAASGMSISRQLKKMSKKEMKKEEVRAQLMIEKANKFLGNKDALGDVAGPLEQVKGEFEAAIAAGDPKRAAFLAKSLGKQLSEAGKAIYKANK
jgi:alkylation response protein AidB-like acyl-CoA dehydrogenase